MTLSGWWPGGKPHRAQRRLRVMKEEDRLSKKIGAAMKDIVVNKKELR
jgi:hypothetical protein